MIGRGGRASSVAPCPLNAVRTYRSGPAPVAAPDSRRDRSDGRGRGQAPPLQRPVSNSCMDQTERVPERPGCGSPLRTLSAGRARGEGRTHRRGPLRPSDRPFCRCLGAAGGQVLLRCAAASFPTPSRGRPGRLREHRHDHPRRSRAPSGSGRISSTMTPAGVPNPAATVPKRSPGASGPNPAMFHGRSGRQPYRTAARRSPRKLRAVRRPWRVRETTRAGDGRPQGSPQGSPLRLPGISVGGVILVFVSRERGYAVSTRPTGRSIAVLAPPASACCSGAPPSRPCRDRYLPR